MNSFFSSYLEKVYDENDPKKEIEDEYKSKNEPVRWALIKGLSMEIFEAYLTKWDS